VGNGRVGRTRYETEVHRGCSNVNRLCGLSAADPRSLHEDVMDEPCNGRIDLNIPRSTCKYSPSDHSTILVTPLHDSLELLDKSKFTMHCLSTASSKPSPLSSGEGKAIANRPRELAPVSASTTSSTRLQTSHIMQRTKLWE